MTRREPAAAACPDSDAVRARYEEERLRRTPGKGERRYRDVADGFAHLLKDPYTDPTPREPLFDEVEVLIVGGGFGGLLTAARLKQAGVKRVRIVDAAGEVGGTWYWNRYPGAACDVESYIYLPLLEETGYMPVERYSKAPEIREHCRRIATAFDLHDDAVLSTQATALSWNAPAANWEVATDRGDRMRARFVVLTTGPLNRPKLPDVPGLDSFAGHAFHTSRWDYAYTGGSEHEPMDRLSDKVVGIIGTGATAVQCVPPLASAAKRLLVFQRTPSSVSPRDNAPTDPAWSATLEPGWQQRRIESFTQQLAGNIAEPDLVGDGWTVLARAMRQKVMADPSRLADPEALLREADLETVAALRERIEAVVEDRATAEALKPWYSIFCKRPCFHDFYLQTFNRPNVELVDTGGRGVERVTRTGVVAGGVEHRLDCLIFATGFETSTDYAKRSGFSVVGVDGLTLSDKWAEGVSTLHGMHSRGFPNLFVLSHAQAGMSVNFPHMISEQAEHVAHIVAETLRQDVRTIEATEAAENAWVETILVAGEARRRLLEGCTPGYYTNEGRPSQAAERSASYGAGPMAFVQVLRDWRAAGIFEGLELDGVGGRPGAEMAA